MGKCCLFDLFYDMKPLIRKLCCHRCNFQWVFAKDIVIVSFWRCGTLKYVCWRGAFQDATFQASALVWFLFVRCEMLIQASPKSPWYGSLSPIKCYHAFQIVHSSKISGNGMLARALHVRGGSSKRVVSSVWVTANSKRGSAQWESTANDPLCKAHHPYAWDNCVGRFM